VNSTGIKRLRDRWTPAMVRRVSGLLIAKPARRVWDLTAAAVDTDDDGFADLRGFPLHEMSDLTASHVDLSHASSPLNEHGMDSLAFVVQCRLHDCRFVGARRFHRIDGAFVRCDFGRVRAPRAALIGSFDDCDFSGADLTGAAAPGSVFRRCRYDGAKLVRVHFGGCVFDGCDLRNSTWGFGSVCGARFVGCDLTDVDFKDTVRDETTTFDESCKTARMRFTDTVIVHGVRVYLGTDERLRAENDVELDRSSKRPRSRSTRRNRT